MVYSVYSVNLYVCHRLSVCVDNLNRIFHFTHHVVSCCVLLCRLSVKYSGDDTAASGKAFVSQIRAAASIISSNHTAMTHALCSALILRRLISSGVSALNWGCITESVSTLSDHADGAFDTILFEEIRTELAAVRASFESKTPFVDACESYGKACAYPGKLRLFMILRIC